MTRTQLNSRRAQPTATVFRHYLGLVVSRVVLEERIKSELERSYPDSFMIRSLRRRQLVMKQKTERVESTLEAPARAFFGLPRPMIGSTPNRRGSEALEATTLAKMFREGVPGT